MRLVMATAVAAAAGPLLAAAAAPDTEATAQDQRARIAAMAARYAAAWTSGDAASVAAFFAPDGRLTINGGAPATGRDAIAADARGFMDAFPDLAVTFDRLGYSGGRWLFHWTLTGTATGPGGKGAAVRISGVEAWLIGPDGLITESSGSFDAADYARQLERGASASDADLAPILTNRTGVILVEIQREDVFDQAGVRLFGGHAALLWRRIEGRWLIAADFSN